MDFIAAIERGDKQAVLDAYAEDGSCWVSGNTLISGTMSREQVATACDQIFTAFPDGLKFTVHSVTAEDDRVAVEAESNGRHSSGQWYNNRYHFLARLCNGKITQWREYMDTELVTDVICGGIRPEKLQATGKTNDG